MPPEILDLKPEISKVRGSLEGLKRYGPLVYTGGIIIFVVLGYSIVSTETDILNTTETLCLTIAGCVMIITGAFIYRVDETYRRERLAKLEHRQAELKRLATEAKGSQVEKLKRDIEKLEREKAEEREKEIDKLEEEMIKLRGEALEFE